MTLQEQLLDLEAQKQQLKINAFKALNLSEVTQDGVTLQIDSITQENGLLSVTATHEGKQEKFLFKNPPILVPDGTTRTELIDGEEVEVNNYKEDIQEALTQILTQAAKIKWQL